MASWADTIIEHEPALPAVEWTDTASVEQTSWGAAAFPPEQLGSGDSPLGVYDGAEIKPIGVAVT